MTDGGLSFLSRLSLLCELDLTDYTHVTDQGVRQLSSLTRLVPRASALFPLLLSFHTRTNLRFPPTVCRLKKLSLSNTQVTDVGLPSLLGMQELQQLCLDRTAVTSRGVAQLITQLPHLQVRRDFIP